MELSPNSPAMAPLSPFAARLAAMPRAKLEALSEAVIAIIDLMDGDADREPSGDEMDVGWPERPGMGQVGWASPAESEDCEPEGDEQDLAWTEWHSRTKQRSALHETTGSIRDEDDEPDDHAEDDDTDSEHDGREPGGDDEIAQMEQDVPCIPVVTLEPNIFNGQRQLLGYTLPRPTRDGPEAELSN